MASERAPRGKRTLAEAQTAGFGGANGKVVDRLVAAFDADRPAITIRHERVDHPDPFEDRDAETTTVETMTVTPDDEPDARKVELGTRHGNDRVRVESNAHAPRAYVRHEHDDGDEWVAQAAWELHPATGIEQVGDSAAGDAGGGRRA